MANGNETTINVVQESVLTESLKDVMRVNKNVFLDAVSMVFDKKKDLAASAIDNQTSSFKALANNIDSMSNRLFDSDTRGKSLVAERQLSILDKKIKEDTNITMEERDALHGMMTELKGVNKSLLQNEHSLRSAITGTLKDNLPSLTGILSSIGMANPGFLFLGQTMQTIADKRRQSKLAEQAMMEEHHKEKIKSELEGIEAAKQNEAATEKLQDAMIDQAIKDQAMMETSDDQLALLQHIDSMVSIMVKDSKAEQFAEIERNREALRREERLIDAIEHMGMRIEESVQNEEIEDGKFSFTGLMGEAAGFMNSILASLIVAKTFVGKAAKNLFRVAKRFAGPIGLALTAVEFFRGAAKGWEDAAIKLGKESATTSDKIASAIGGGLGSVVEVADSLLGLFGFETDMAGWVDDATTRILASGFETISGWADSFTGLMGKISSFAANIENSIADFVINAVDSVKNTVYSIFSSWMDISFPEGEFSFEDIILIPMRQAKFWAESLFDFDLPEIPPMKEIVGDKLDGITNAINDIFDSVLNVFEGFSIREFLGFGDSKEAIETVAGIEDAKPGFFASLFGMGSQDIEPESEIEGRAAPAASDMDTVWPRPLDLSDEGEVIDFMPEQPRAMMNEQLGEIMSNEQIQKEKAANNAPPTVIHAPSQKVNNVSNATSLHQTPVSPYETDLTFARMQMAIGH